MAEVAAEDAAEAAEAAPAEDAADAAAEAVPAAEAAAAAAALAFGVPCAYHTKGIKCTPFWRCGIQGETCFDLLYIKPL